MTDDPPLVADVLLHLGKDVLAHIGFEPIIRGEPKLMDARIFAAEPMGLKDDLLTVPLEARFAYDAGRNMFFLNMEGMSLGSKVTQGPPC